MLPTNRAMGQPDRSAMNNSYVIPLQILTCPPSNPKVRICHQVVARLGTRHSSVVLVGSNHWRSHHCGFVVLIGRLS